MNIKAHSPFSLAKIRKKTYSYDATFSLIQRWFPAFAGMTEGTAEVGMTDAMDDENDKTVHARPISLDQAHTVEPLYGERIRGKGASVPRAELLPEERRLRPLRVAVTGPVGVAELDPALATMEDDVRHVRPQLLAGNLHLVARDPDVRHLVAIHALDPLRMERGGGEDSRVRRGLRGAHVLRLLVALASEVDHLPAEANLVLDAREESQAIRADLVVAVPTPVSVLLGLRTHPQFVKRALEAGRDRLIIVRLFGEIGNEHDRDEPILGPGRNRLLRLGERLVADTPTEPLVPFAHARDLLLGRGEEAVDEREARVAHQRLVHDLGELVVVAGVHLADDFRREACASEASLELRDLSIRRGRKAGHGGLPPLSAVQLVRSRGFAV